LNIIFTGSAILSGSLVAVLQQDNGPTVLNFYGATETLPLAQNISDRHDWPFISFRPESGVSFEHETDDLWEFIIRKPPGNDPPMSVFCSFPELEVYRSKDLFSPHPRKSGLWRFVCRKDDMLSLASGQGINIKPMEDVFADCPLVDTVIIGQDGRPSTVLLVVPRKESTADNEAKAIRESLKPFISSKKRTNSVILLLRFKRTWYFYFLHEVNCHQ